VIRPQRQLASSSPAVAIAPYAGRRWISSRSDSTNTRGGGGPLTEAFYQRMLDFEAQQRENRFGMGV
jgi:hypothetical protein